MARSGVSLVVWVLCAIALIVFSWPIITDSAEPFRPEDFWHFVAVWLAVLVGSRALRLDSPPDESQPSKDLDS